MINIIKPGQFDFIIDRLIEFHYRPCAAAGSLFIRIDVTGLELNIESVTQIFVDAVIHYGAKSIFSASFAHQLSGYIKNKEIADGILEAYYRVGGKMNFNETTSFKSETILKKHTYEDNSNDQQQLSPPATNLLPPIQ